MSEIVQAVIKALDVYGEAARNNYLDLDGKQIQRDMWTITDALESSDTYTAGELIEQLSSRKSNASAQS